MPLNNDDIMQLISILQKALVDEEQKETEQKETEQRDPNNSTVYKKPNTKEIGGQSKNKKVANSHTQHYNKFESMPEKNMHKDDTKIDKVLSQYSPTERTRQFNFINVNCRVCGRTDSINPALVYDSENRYKCNKCSKIPG
jgi:hypothetical protein